MKKTTFKLLIVCLLFSAAFTRCQCEEPVEAIKMLDALKGKCYILGSVTKGGTPVTSDFTGFKICFNPDGLGGTINTGGTTPQNLTVQYNITGEATSGNITGTITIQGTPPTGWAVNLASVETDKDGNTLKFTVNINNPKTGQADHRFELVKQ